MSLIIISVGYDKYHALRILKFTIDLDKGMNTFSSINGQPVLKRAMEISIAGCHNLFLFGAASEDRDSTILAFRDLISQSVNRGPVPDYGIMNSCECGNLGAEDKICFCSYVQLKRFRFGIAAKTLERYDMRVPFNAEQSLSTSVLSREAVGLVTKRICKSRCVQRFRFQGERFDCNGEIPTHQIPDYCRLERNARDIWGLIIQKLNLTSFACFSILKISRTIADLEYTELILKEHLLEAVFYRRYGDSDLYWSNCSE